uniref:Calcium-transporting ATPase 11, plasma membrane-type n=1 Tax=Cajanus cajan TaxID=3821 RepID=A0A151TTZ5_CAJCA|nr:Putative calcium-transporting ATPase 11, plasma membrane-type [Cajanus cajan]
MESRLLKDFELHHKNPSLEALRRWRSAVALVKNRRRRFRMVADLDKRSEAEQIKQGIKVLFHFPLPPLFISSLSVSMFIAIYP